MYLCLRTQKTRLWTWPFDIDFILYRYDVWWLWFCNFFKKNLVTIEHWALNLWHETRQFASRLQFYYVPSISRDDSSLVKKSPPVLISIDSFRKECLQLSWNLGKLKRYINWHLERQYLSYIECFCMPKLAFISAEMPGFINSI